MKKLLAILLLAAAITYGQDSLVIGEKIRTDYILGKSSELNLNSSESINQLHKIKTNGITYFAKLNKENQLTFVQTTDTKFTDKSGLKIGAEYQSAKKIVKAPLKKENGWGYYIKLESGWNALFLCGDTGTDFPPKPDSKIIMFFKR